MDIDQVLSIAWKIILSIGGIGVIVVGLFTWLSKIIGDNIYLRTQAKYDKEIETLRAEFSESQESLKSALSALSTGYNLSHEKVWEALSLLWNKIIELHQFSYTYLRLYATAGDNRDVFKRIGKVTLHTFPSTTFSECYDKLGMIEEGMVYQRPFIDKSLWYMYSTYFEITRTICLKAAFGLETEGFVEWDKLDKGEKDKLLLSRINTALTEEDIAHVKKVIAKAKAGKGFMPMKVLEALENEIAGEISQWIFGEKLASASIEQQEQLISLREQGINMKGWIKPG